MKKRQYKKNVKKIELFGKRLEQAGPALARIFMPRIDYQGFMQQYILENNVAVEAGISPAMSILRHIASGKGE